MTLVDLLRDIARSCQEAAHQAVETNRQRFLSDFDKEGKPSTVPVATTGESVDAPAASLRDHRALTIGEVELGLDTDVSLAETVGEGEASAPGIEVHLRSRRRGLFRNSNHSRLKVKVTLRDLPPPEGQSLVLERLDEDLRQHLHRAAITAPLETLTAAAAVSTEDQET